MKERRGKACEKRGRRNMGLTRCLKACIAFPTKSLGGNGRRVCTLWLTSIRAGGTLVLCLGAVASTSVKAGARRQS